MSDHYDCACFTLASILHRDTSDCPVGQQTSPVAEKKRKGKIELFFLQTKRPLLLSFRLKEFPCKGNVSKNFYIELLRESLFPNDSWR